MLRVYFNRNYTKDSLKEMKEWCRSNCTNEFIAGHPPAAGFFGDQLDYYDSQEIPWRFEDDEDAVLFRIRWLP